MRNVALVQSAVAAGLNLASGGAFCRALRFPAGKRRVLLAFLTTVVLASPLFIRPRGAGVLRFVMSAMAVQTAFRLYDLHASAAGQYLPTCRAFVGDLFNPFSIVLRRVRAERPKSPREDQFRFLAGLSVGAAAIVLLVWLFHIDWARYPFALEHCAKVICFLLIIQVLLNGLAAGYRLAGLPATDFAENFVLSATPAEFWRRYNRPVEQFFFQYVFRPAGGFHHPLRATMAVFAFSAVVHEYIFDVAAGRVLGYQAAFFLIHGAAAAMTLRLRLTGPARVLAMVPNSAFNLATAYLFFESMNAFVDFYAPRAG
jgi:hypothetical protein